MKLFLLGATGRTGRRVVDQALARGHAVTAIIRRPGALQAREGLRVEAADARSADDLTRLLVGHDVVISCLGQRARGDASLLRDAAAAALTAMGRAGMRRYLVVSQGLVFPSRNPGSCCFGSSWRDMWRTLSRWSGWSSPATSTGPSS